MYTVTWGIEVDASSPLEAAEQARVIQQDPQVIAGIFDVTDERGDTTRVNLGEGE